MFKMNFGMRLVFCAFFGLVLAALAAGCEENEKAAGLKKVAAPLVISVYYETLCPDSIRFITRHLYPLYTELGNLGNPYFEIDFVPYGKANTTFSDGNYSFICQHGPRECEGNKVHACALQYLEVPTNFSNTAAFINCSMSSADPPSAGPACAEQLGLDFSIVEACLNRDGPELLAELGNRTHSLDPTLYSVPWIIHNNVFNEDDLWDSQVDLLTVVCKKLADLGGPMPDACRKAAAPLVISTYYETLCPDSIRFITRHLYPLYEDFGGLGNPFFEIGFVPYGKANTTFDAGSGNYSFICQHGPRECEGNKVHACALKHLNVSTSAAFINCSMSSTDPPAAGPVCAFKLGFDFSPIENCLSMEGPELLASLGNRTHSLDPELYYVPWIIHNDVFNEDDLWDSQTDLLAVVCKKLTELGGAVPDSCDHRK